VRTLHYTLPIGPFGENEPPAGRIRREMVSGSHGTPKASPANVRWLASRLGAGPLSWALKRGGKVVRVTCIGEEGYIEPADDDDRNGPATVGTLTGRELSTRIANHYNIVIKRTDSNGKVFYTEEWFPVSDCERVLDVTDALPYVRPLRGVTHTPLLRAEPGAGLLTEP